MKIFNQRELLISEAVSEKGGKELQMGRSPSFCFSIKACAGKEDDGDFSTLKEVKASPEKRRWSFRKKNDGHHVPSNTVISEPLPIFSKNQNPEATDDTFYSEKSPSYPDKASVVEQTSPTLQLPSAVASSRAPKELSNTPTVLVDHNIPEHVIVIQTSIRRCLAQNELQKLVSSRSAELSAPVCVSDQFLVSSVQDNEQQSCVQETVTIENDKDWSKREAKEVSNYISSRMQWPLDASLHLELDGNPSKPDYTQDNFENGARNELIGVEESEEGKALNGCGKSKNPAFAAVQAKFEELSSDPDSNASSIIASVSKSAHSQVDFTSKEVNDTKPVYSKVDKEVTLKEKPSSYSPNGQGSPSGLGTEISVSSLGRPEDSVAEIVPELRTSDESSHGVVNVANGSLEFDEMKPETKNYLSNFVPVQPQRKAESSKNAPISVSSVKAVQVEEDAYVDEISLYESPRSHDSPTAPSNQISLRIRTVKAEDSILARKKKSQFAVKNSPTHLKNDSDARGSGEHLRKGIKNVKRPDSSSGSDKTNHDDHEDRNSSNSLPNYMQLTESAKAKINISFLQKSNIGLHHKDDLIKKRHSLLIVNEKRGLSPRAQSPKSQTSQDLKVKGASSDNSTERRWQL